MALDQAPHHARLDVAQGLYATKWAISAGHLDQQGCYEWIAARLKDVNPKLILDIGTGTGEGIAALLKRFDCEIISIDENRVCLQRAFERLRDSGVDTELISRLRFVPVSDGMHQLGVEHGKIQRRAKVTLIEGDLLAEDDELKQFLGKAGPFDAMTVWLIGSHQARNDCINLKPLNIRSAGEYRLRVQNRSYVLANEVLRKGGVLQVVDRGEVPEQEFLREDTLRSHREQAGPTQLEVFEHDFVEYTEPASDSGVKMEATIGTSGRIPKLRRLAMISVRSRRP